MSLFAVGRHCQVLIETPESVARREQNTRLAKRYEMFCTCKTKRREHGHCVHTIAIFRESIKPQFHKRISLVECETPNGGPPLRPRIDLEREIIQLRAQLEGPAA